MDEEKDSWSEIPQNKIHHLGLPTLRTSVRHGSSDAVASLNLRAVANFIRSVKIS